MSDDTKLPAVHTAPNLDMGETFGAMSEAHTRNISIPRSNAFRRSDVVNAFQSAFDLIGGVPRLATWAHENPGDFFKLYGKLLPSQSSTQIEQSGQVTILHAIQPGPLDGVVIEGDNVVRMTDHKEKEDG